MPWEKSLERLGIHQKIPSVLYKMLFGSVKDKGPLGQKGFQGCHATMCTCQSTKWRRLARNSCCLSRIYSCLVLPISRALRVKSYTGLCCVLPPWKWLTEKWIWPKCIVLSCSKRALSKTERKKIHGLGRAYIDIIHINHLLNWFYLCHLPYDADRKKN